MPKLCGFGWLNKLRLADFPRRPFFRVLIQLGTLGTFFVGDTTYTLSEISVDIIGRGLGVVLGRWGGSGPWYFGDCPWLMLSIDLPLRGGVSRMRGPASPRRGRGFFLYGG